MDTNNAHPPKDTYQLPASRLETDSFSEPFEAQLPLSEEAVNQQFKDIAHEEVRLSFERITQEIALSASGIESPYIDTPEIIHPHPIALRALQLGDGIKQIREKRYEKSIKRAQRKRLGESFLSALLGENSSASRNPKLSPDDVLEDEVSRELRVVGELHVRDAQVKSQKFYYYPNDIHDEWFHQQVSTVRAKNFTNSYIVKETGFEKSSTYFDETEDREKNVLVIPSDAEIENFINAAQRYHDAVKDDYDLAA